MIDIVCIGQKNSTRWDEIIMINEYAVLYLEINLVSIALVSIILYKTNGLSKMVAQRNFALSIAAEIIFFASDTLFVMINEGIININLGVINNNTVRFACKEIYFFASAWMCYFWFIYFELVRDAAFFREKKNIMLTSTAVWVFFLILFANIFTGFLFRVDEKGTYVRGSLFYVAYIFSYIYVAVACLRTFHLLHTKAYTTDRRIIVLHSLFPLAPGLAGIIQYFYPRMPVACVTMAITTLLFYHTWIDQLISLDPLTGLNNRKQLDHFYEHWGKNHNEGDLLYILMIDANKFKYINDNFGHIQGDQALKNIAEALRISCKSLPKRANISRYGGDEFAVLFEDSGPGTSVKLEKSIRETLEKVNEQTDIPFKLTVCIGSSYTDGSLTLKELIDKADEDMYEEKSAYAR